MRVAPPLGFAVIVALIVAASPACTRVVGYEPLTFVEGIGVTSCASGRGPAMVRAGTFCIDATEVTNSHYTAFLAASPGAWPGRPSACGFKTTHVPKEWPRPTDESEHPVRYIDWCDAWAFCAWSNKRLCGSVGGSALPVAALGDTATDEWYRACTSGGTRAFPYGATYEKGRCNAEEVSSGPVQVGSFGDCVGGYAGLYDMSGNVREWVDACEGNAGAKDTCATRGGEWDRTASSEHACAYSTLRDREHRSSGIGIRCCAP
jgi:formylglycine-generating enzyme